MCVAPVDTKEPANQLLAGPDEDNAVIGSVSRDLKDVGARVS